MRWIGLAVLFLVWVTGSFLLELISPKAPWQLVAGIVYVVFGLLLLRTIDLEWLDPVEALREDGWAGLLICVPVLVVSLIVLLAVSFPFPVIAMNRWFFAGSLTGIALYVLFAWLWASSKTTYLPDQKPRRD